MKTSTISSLAVLGLACGLFATVASAHSLPSVNANVVCQGYELTVNTLNFAPGDFVSYTFTTNCGSQMTNFTGTIVPPTPGTTPLTASGTWSLTDNCTVSGTASVVDAQGTTIFGPMEMTTINNQPQGVPATLNCSPPMVCTTGPQALAYNVSEQNKNAGEIVWFNSHFKLQGTVPTTDFTVDVTDQAITFGAQTLLVPPAVITFSSTASCASTTFNTALNRWETTIPLSSASKADEIFSAGLAFLLPPNFAQNVNNVSWKATFSSTAPSLKFAFQYGAANYLTNSKGNSFPMLNGQPDMSAMLIKPVHNASTCANYSTGDHAGTPENPTVKSLVTGGGSGGGGSNWTGSWSSTPTYICK